MEGPPVLGGPSTAATRLFATPPALRALELLHVQPSLLRLLVGLTGQVMRPVGLVLGLLRLLVCLLGVLLGVLCALVGLVGLVLRLLRLVLRLVGLVLGVLRPCVG